MEAPPQQPTPPEMETHEPRPTVNLLSEAWSIAFANLTAFLPVVGAMFGFFLILGVVFFFIAFSAASQGQQPGVYSTSQWLAMRGVTIAITCLIAVPLNTGLFGIAFRVLDATPSPTQGFNAALKYYGPSVLFGLITTVATSIIEFALRSINPIVGGVINMVVSIAISIPLIFVIPAMVRFDWRLGDALRYSFNRVSKYPLAIFGFYFAAALMSVVGLIACGFGVIFTMPIYYIALALLFPSAVRQAPVSQYPREYGPTI